MRFIFWAIVILFGIFVIWLLFIRNSPTVTEFPLYESRDQDLEDDVFFEIENSPLEGQDKG